jgi:hypothetical protein
MLLAQTFSLKTFYQADVHGRSYSAEVVTGVSAADRVTALEQTMGINYDGAVRGLMPRLKNIELEVMGEIGSGKIGDRLDGLEQVV